MLLEWAHYPSTSAAEWRRTLGGGGGLRTCNLGFAYVVDLGNERIQVFAPSNQSLTISNQ